MTRPLSHLALPILLAAALAASACFQPIERPGAVVPTAADPTSPTPTSTTITHTPTPTIPPTPTPTPEPTRAPADTPVPTSTPALPLLEVYGPTTGSIVHTNIVVVYGQTRPDAAVTVNGSPATVSPDGSFRAGIVASQGNNRIQVVATDPSGSRAVQMIEVALQPLYPLFLSVTEPLNPSVVSRRTIPVSGLTTPDAKITVNGKAVPVTPVQVPELPNRELGLFLTTVTLTPGPNVIEVAATNSAGEVIRFNIAVVLRP